MEGPSRGGADDRDRREGDARDGRVLVRVRVRARARATATARARARAYPNPNPNQVEFDDVISGIDAGYDATEVEFEVC